MRKHGTTWRDDGKLVQLSASAKIPPTLTTKDGSGRTSGDSRPRGSSHPCTAEWNRQLSVLIAIQTTASEQNKWYFKPQNSGVHCFKAVIRPSVENNTCPYLTEETETQKS